MQDKTDSENALRQRKFRQRKLAEKLAEINRVNDLIETFKTAGTDEANNRLKKIKFCFRYIEVDQDGDIHVNLKETKAREDVIKKIEYLLISIRKADAKNKIEFHTKQKVRLNLILERQQLQSQRVIKECKQIDGEMKKLNAVLKK